MSINCETSTCLIVYFNFKYHYCNIHCYIMTIISKIDRQVLVQLLEWENLIYRFMVGFYPDGSALCSPRRL